MPVFYPSSFNGFLRRALVGRVKKNTQRKKIFVLAGKLRQAAGKLHGCLDVVEYNRD